MFARMTMTAGALAILLPMTATPTFAQEGGGPTAFEGSLYRMEHTPTQGSYTSASLNDLKTPSTQSRSNVATQIPKRNPESSLHASR